MKFEVYQRASARDPWLKKTDISLVADQGLVVRNEAAAPGSESITFHPLGLQRFLVQAFLKLGFLKNDYVYGVLEVRNGEGFLSMMACEDLDQRAFRAAGGTIKPGDTIAQILHCELDSAPRPLELLRSIAARPPGPEERYVPVR
jgi:hypothetical protein